MVILIAESKTMRDDQAVVAPDVFAAHRPAGEDGADLIMARLGRLSGPELIAETGLSASLAAKLRQMIYEFPNKALGLRAIEAYTGVVFKALGYDSLSRAAQQACDGRVALISSLYGFLRPDDVVKPYRLDFTAKAAPDGASLFSFWKKDVTIALVKAIREGGHAELLSLLPSDAAKCIDWKIVKRFCKVWKADFVEITDGNQTKTPSATKLKTMRGKLLRLILSRGLERIADIREAVSDDFVCEGSPVYPDHLQFLC